jgi:hypothetical protein
MARAGSPKQGDEEQLSGERDGIEILPVGGVVARWSSRISPSRSGSPAGFGH